MIFNFNSSDIQKTQTKISEYVSRKSGKYILEIRRAKEKRSLNQNKYYWGVVVVIMSDEFGYTAKEVHQILTREFLGYERNGQRFVKSTKELNTAEFESYLDKVRAWAFSEHGIHIPLPNEVTEEMLMQLNQLER